MGLGNVSMGAHMPAWRRRQDTVIIAGVTDLAAARTSRRSCDCCRIRYTYSISEQRRLTLILAMMAPWHRVQTSASLTLRVTPANFLRVWRERGGLRTAPGGYMCD
jgi:hypothetical protein